MRGEHLLGPHVLARPHARRSGQSRPACGARVRSGNGTTRPRRRPRRRRARRRPGRLHGPRPTSGQARRDAGRSDQRPAAVPKPSVLVGVGPRDELDPEAFAAGGGRTGRRATKTRRVATTISTPRRKVDDAEANAQALAEGVTLGSYQFLRYKGNGKPTRLDEPSWSVVPTPRCAPRWRAASTVVRTQSRGHATS